MKNSQQMIRQAFCAFVAPCALALTCSATAFAQDASTTYNPARKDPFVRYKPPVKRKVVKKVATPVAVPSVEARIERYKAQKAAAMNLQQPAPKPTTALLLGEVQVTGIFRTPRGYAAMVEATPINLSYVIYPGERFYDGMLVAIEEHRLVFRRETLWTDGRREVAVDTKPLRQPDAVRDSMTTTKTTVANKQTASEATEKKDAREESAATNGNR
ncbi:MAG TPA: hypothetical protein VF754_04635 [Pyrinomonadaceae bacterium]